MASIIVNRLEAQPASHQEFSTLQIWDKTQLRIIATWAVRNTGNADLWLGSTMTLVHVKGFFQQDEDVVEYAAGDGIITDEIGQGGTIVAAGPYHLRPGDTFWPFRMDVPGTKGPFGGFLARQWWTANDDANFNLRLDLFELPFASARASQGRHLGGHEYKKFVNVQYNIGFP